MNIWEISDIIQQKKGEWALLNKRYNTELINNEQAKKQLEYIDSAMTFLQTKALENQRRLSFHINNFISDILEVVWGDDAYKFELSFVEKRNKTEVEMLLINEYGETSLKKPNNIRGGGGVLDLVAFGLRVALWSLKNNSQYTMILDQPFQNLDAEHMPLVSELLTNLSEKLELQFIMVNHNKLLGNSANITYKVVKENGESKVNILN